MEAHKGVVEAQKNGALEGLLTSGRQIFITLMIRIRDEESRIRISINGMRIRNNGHKGWKVKLIPISSALKKSVSWRFETDRAHVRSTGSHGYRSQG